MQTNPEQWADNANVQRAVMASVNLGAWMSAALDDPKVCDAMKADIREWFSAGEPVSAIQAAFAEREARLVGDMQAIIDHFDCYHGNAPGHGHLIPGVWDKDASNGAMGGTKCGWCEQWKDMRATLAALKDRTHG